MFVRDFEEYSLQLADSDPKQVVGRTKFGNGRICAVEGQSPAAPFTIQTPGERSDDHSLLLWSDRRPGVVFAPAVYFDPAGQAYLAESLASIEFHGTEQSIRASWIPASDSFTPCSKTGD